MFCSFFLLPVLMQQTNPLDNLTNPSFKSAGPGVVQWVGSPNFGDRPSNALIDTIVLHHTASSNLEGVVKWFNMTESQVSAHYTVGKDGAIAQSVSTFKRAWHAGKSTDSEGRENLNNFTIGIEMVNVGDGKDPWPDAQVEAVARLCRTLIRYRFKQIKYITSHEYIAEPQGRKNDPINFPWDKFKSLMSDFPLEYHYGLKPKNSN
ncbi:MAG: N-acetylmuramoyl-L-alanine amidase [Armatimonadetes bacterium]|nr:N-acetylmuramoyl-L-alanine amidase [Armatimonadota bacterium]